jgi:hypothetical protein
LIFLVGFPFLVKDADSYAGDRDLVDGSEFFVLYFEELADWGVDRVVSVFPLGSS